MKKDTFVLRIDDPCGQDWAAMERADGGRYCESCAKNVVDFSGLTTNQIAAALQKSDGKICARLAPHQLNRLLRPLPEPSTRGRFVRAATSALLLLAAKEATAQPKPATHRVPAANDWQEIRAIDTPRPRLPPYDSSKAVLTGRVLDAETKQPLVGARVGISRTITGATTNANGFFSLAIPEAQWQASLTFFVFNRGYQSTKFSVGADDLSSIEDIFLLEAKTFRFTTGGLTVVKSQRKWWQRSKRKGA